MTRLALLIGSFLLTFALLISAWMVAGPRPGAVAPTASPVPSSTQAPPASPAPPSPPPTPTPSAQPTATASPLPTTPPTPTPSVSPAPLRTLPASFEPLPSSDPGGTQTFAMTGAEFTSYQIPENGRLVRNGDLAVLTTTDDTVDALWVTYSVDPADLPVGVIIHTVNALICGHGTGAFWEVYGPTGSTPTEYEVVPPGADGCWRFADAPTTDMSIIASTMLASQLVIERVEFTIIFGR